LRQSSGSGGSTSTGSVPTVSPWTCPAGSFALTGRGITSRFSGGQTQGSARGPVRRTDGRGLPGGLRRVCPGRLHLRDRHPAGVDQHQLLPPHLHRPLLPPLHHRPGRRRPPLRGRAAAPPPREPLPRAAPPPHPLRRTPPL